MIRFLKRLHARFRFAQQVRRLRPWYWDDEWWWPRDPEDHIAAEERYRQLTGKFFDPETLEVSLERVRSAQRGRMLSEGRLVSLGRGQRTATKGHGN